jgi:predicted DNA-binding transcriptional regulator AlpA
MKEALLDLFYPPRGMSRIQSAAYISVSPSLFDQMVADGRMPQPRMINKRVVWDRVELDVAFSALPHKDEAAGDESADETWKARV